MTNEPKERLVKLPNGSWVLPSLIYSVKYMPVDRGAYPFGRESLPAVVLIGGDSVANIREYLEFETEGEARQYADGFAKLVNEGGEG